MFIIAYNTCQNKIYLYIYKWGTKCTFHNKTETKKHLVSNKRRYTLSAMLEILYRIISGQKYCFWKFLSLTHVCSPDRRVWAGLVVVGGARGFTLS